MHTSVWLCMWDACTQNTLLCYTLWVQVGMLRLVPAAASAFWWAVCRTRLDSEAHASARILRVLLRLLLHILLGRVF